MFNNIWKVRQTLLCLCVIRVELGYFRSGAQLARTGIKRSTLVALLYFPNVVKPNGSNPDDESFRSSLDAQKNVSTELQISLSPCKWMRKSLSGPHSITWLTQKLFGHYVNLTSTVDTLAGGLINTVSKGYSNVNAHKLFPWLPQRQSGVLSWSTCPPVYSHEECNETLPNQASTRVECRSPFEKPFRLSKLNKILLSVFLTREDLPIIGI